MPLKHPDGIPDAPAIGRAVRMLVGGHLRALGLALSEEFYGRIETFADTLALWGGKLNLTAAPDDPAQLAFHVVDSLAPLFLVGTAGRDALRGAFDPGVEVLDLGSGAGFPALILGAATATRFTLAEARRKRASFLAVAAAAMGLTNVRVESSRIELTGSAARFATVTARAFAEPSIVCRTAAAMLKPGGRLILYASPSQRQAIERAGTAAFEPPTLLPYEIPDGGGGAVAHLLLVANRR